MDILINVTISATVTAALILLAKAMFKNRLTPRWHVAIWMILAVRLLVPILPESDLSMQNYIPTVEVEREVSYGGLDEQAEFSPSKNSSGQTFYLKSAGGNGETRLVAIEERRVNGILIIWALGTIVFAACFAFASFRFRRKSADLPLCTDEEVLGLFKECKEALEIKKEISIRTEALSPMLAGIGKPVIYISGGYTSEELRHVIIHELCHYKSRDVLINVAAVALLCLHWYNPVLWICFSLLRRDMEVYCDQRAIAITGKKKEYAKVLLKTASQRNAFLLGTTCLQGGEKEVSKRIKAIAAFKKPKTWILALAAVCVLAIGVFCLTDGAALGGGVTTLGLGPDNAYLIDVQKNSVEEVKISTLEVGEGDYRHNLEESYRMEKNSQSAPVEVTYFIEPLRQRGGAYEGYILYEKQMLNSGGNKNQLIEDERAKETPTSTYLFLMPEMNASQSFKIAGEKNSLLQAAATFRTADDPFRFQPVIQSGNTWTDDAETLLSMYFENWKASDMADNDRLGGYRPRVLKSTGYANNINEPRRDGGSGYEGQDVPWDVIYDAIIYEVEYEITRFSKEKESLRRNALFVKHPYDKNLSQTCFVGFLEEENVKQAGTGFTALTMLDAWYEAEILPILFETYKTAYIGNHVADREIIGRLPLQSYYAGIELETAKEPYKISVAYDFTGKNFENTTLLFRRGTPSEQLESPEVNRYIDEALRRNTSLLLALIENADMAEAKTKTHQYGVSLQHTYLMDRQNAIKYSPADTGKK